MLTPSYLLLSLVLPGLLHLGPIAGASSDDSDQEEPLTPKFVDLYDLSIEEFCEGCKAFVNEVDKQLDDPVTRTDKELSVYLDDVCEEIQPWTPASVYTVCTSIMEVGNAKGNLQTVFKAATDSSPRMVCHDLFNVCREKDPDFAGTGAKLRTDDKGLLTDTPEGMRKVDKAEFEAMRGGTSAGAGMGQNGTYTPYELNTNEYCEGCKILMKEVNNQLDIHETRTLNEVEAYLRELCDDVEGWFPPSVAITCRNIVPAQTLTVSGLIQMKVGNLEESVCGHFLKACKPDDPDFENKTETEEKKKKEEEEKKQKEEEEKKKEMSKNKKQKKKKTKSARSVKDADHLNVEVKTEL